MEVKAKANHIKMSPRKVRLVVDVVRKMKVGPAKDQLTFISKNAAKPIKKLIESAVANGVNNFELEEDNLFIKEIRVDEGQTLKRWMPRARGRATPIRKRTSHVTLVLGELVDSGEKKGKKQKLDEPIKIGQKPKKDEGIKVKSKKEKKEKNDEKEEKGKKIVDPRGEGKGKNTVVEGKGQKGFADKLFRRKSG